MQINTTQNHYASSLNKNNQQVGFGMAKVDLTKVKYLMPKTAEGQKALASAVEVFEKTTAGIKGTVELNVKSLDRYAKEGAKRSDGLVQYADEGRRVSVGSFKQKISAIFKPEENKGLFNLGNKKVPQIQIEELNLSPIVQESDFNLGAFARQDKDWQENGLTGAVKNLANALSKAIGR